MAEYISGMVSVVIPTYRRCDLLKRAVKSVLGQTYRLIECIVINDNTPNDPYSLALYELIEEFRADERFVFLEQEQHINGAEARNCGIRRAKGEFIAFLDDDNYWKPEKLAHQIDFIQKQGDSCGGVSTLIEYYDDGKLVRRSNPYRDGKICREILRRQVEVSTCTVLLRHRCLDETGYFDNHLRRHQEIQLFTFFTAKYELRLLPEYLTCFTFDDPINAPRADDLIGIKQAFFHSVAPVMETLGAWERKRIHALHSFELAYVYFREKKYGSALKYAMRILIDPKTFALALSRVIQRKREEV